jgi:hypothetical protein
MKEPVNLEAKVRVFAYHQTMQSNVAFAQSVLLIASQLPAKNDLDCVNGLFESFGQNVGFANTEQIAFPVQQLATFHNFVSANFNYYPGSKIIKL